MEKINRIENIEKVILQKPSLEHKDSFIEAMGEFISEGLDSTDIGEWSLTQDDINDFKNNFENYLIKLNNQEKGVNLKDGYVPASTFWIIDKNEFIGRVSIRHKLNEKLLHSGGHIGSAIRLSKRGMGYGTKALELGLIEAKKLNLSKVLLTCDNNNIASYRMIEKCGGILENKIKEKDDKITRRYWIDLK